MKRALPLVLILLSVYSLKADVLDITAFGAVTGSTINTVAIQAAIDSATVHGDTVWVPQGTFTTGTLILKDNVTLYIADGATLRGSGSRSDYPEITPGFTSYADSYTLRSLLYAENVSNITITGEGTFDGNGLAVDFLLNNDDRPFGMRFVSCTNVTISNLKLRSSAFWMMHNLNIDTLTMTNLDVFNHANANNDGLNADGCRNVYIADCDVDSGDDPIVLKGMSLAVMENVIVERCTVATYARALKIGTETNGGFRNIIFRDIVVKPSDFTLPGLPNSARTGINLSIVDGGFLDGMLVENISMTAVRTPIFIRLGDRARQFDPNVPVAGVGSLRNVTLRNITAVAEENITSMISGIPGHYVSNITLENIELTVPGGMGAFPSSFVLPEEEDGKPESDMFGDSIPAYGLYMRHADSIYITNYCVEVENPDGRPYIIYEDVLNTENYQGVENGSAVCTEVVSSVNELTNRSLSLYPNPAAGQLHIDGLTEQPTDFQILDLNGRVVLKGTATSSIDVSALDNGIYLIDMQVEGASMRQRFVVAH